MSCFYCRDDIKAWGFRSFQNRRTEKYLKKLFGKDYVKYERVRSINRNDKVEKRIGQFIDRKSNDHRPDQYHSAIVGVGIWAIYYHYNLSLKTFEQLKIMLEKELNMDNACVWLNPSLRNGAIRSDLALVNRGLTNFKKERKKRLKKLFLEANASSPKKRSRSRKRSKSDRNLRTERKKRPHKRIQRRQTE